MFKWLFKKKGCAKHMNNKLEVIGIDHGWSMMKTISQVFVTGVKHSVAAMTVSSCRTRSLKKFRSQQRERKECSMSRLMKSAMRLMR